MRPYNQLVVGQLDSAMRASLWERPCACYGCTDAKAQLPGHELTCQWPVDAEALKLEKDGLLTRSFGGSAARWIETGNERQDTGLC